MSKRKKMAVAGLGGVAGVGILATAAEAHSGDVVASQDCNGWQVTVSLNHNVTIDRTVEVVSTIPGTTGISGGHYTSSAGEIWSQSGSGNVAGTVTLNIWNGGALEFTDHATLVKSEECVTTTTVAPTTTVPVTTTTERSVCQVPEGCQATTTTTVKQPTTSTTMIRLIPPVSVMQTTSTTVPKQLPHTGAAGTGMEVGSGVVLLAIGVAIWKRVGSKLASQRG